MSRFEYVAVLVSVIAGLGIVDTTWKIDVGLGGFGTLLIIVWSLLIAGSLVAAKVKNHAYHAFWGVAFFAIMTYFEYINFAVLRAD